MIAFATLWLGIVAGPLPVVVLAGPEVARVELRLDGAPVAELSGPPWETTLDLGPEIAPHALVAVAWDAAGAPLGEARQLLNMPRPPTELALAVSRTEGSTEVRLAWAGTGTEAPRSVRAWLDGVPLPESADPRLLELPAFPHHESRLLRIEADFPTGVATREVVLGGEVTLTIDSDVTALPLEIERGAEPRADGLRLETAGVNLPVVSIERGLADLVAVVDPAARRDLQALVNRAERQLGMAAGPPERRVRGRHVTRFLAPMREDHRLRLVLPLSERDTRYELFPVSPELRPTGAGLLVYLAGEVEAEPGAARIADAVALAGMVAARDGRRRAVLLVLAPETADASIYSAAAVRRYLARMRVPLVVWVTGAPTAELLAAWGAARRTDAVTAVERAARDLRETLDRQRVAWVEGRHLPHHVTLVASEDRTRLAGAGAIELVASAEELAASAQELAAAAAEAAAESEADRMAAEAEARAAARAAQKAAAAALVPAGLVTRPFGPFEVATDLRDERLVARLAEVAGALAPSWRERFGLAVEPSGTVLLFGQERSFREWLVEHRTDRGGIAVDGALEGYAVSGTAALHAGEDAPDEVAAVLVHELAHLLTREAFGREMPPWLEEGIAEELAMCRLDHDGRPVAGSLRTNRRVLALGGGLGRPTQVERMVSGPGAALVMLVGTPGSRVPLGELLAATPAAFASPAGRQERYATAGFFVRFLLGEETRAGRFRAFLAAAAAGGGADPPALEAALGRSLADLERDFIGWLRVTAMTSAG